ncbi:MAG TPA: hypothetical protein PLV68_10770 [Ilumatobacteraceae bacterium]|nr:hypothetical protein [Ilumatobacteraceae bacterium]
MSLSSRLVERKLRQSASRLRALRDELRVIDEQLPSLQADADDGDMRALFDETGGSNAEARRARGSAEAMVRQRARVVESIATWERRQDELLDRLARR